MKKFLLVLLVGMAVAIYLYGIVNRLMSDKVKEIDHDRPVEGITREIAEQINISIKYEGYIQRERDQVAHFLKMEGKKIPENIDYSKVKNLRKEARQKLEAVRPDSIGQASRISGVSPADVTMLMIYLKA